MATFYGRSGVRLANNPTSSDLRDVFKGNTFVSMTGTNVTIPFAAPDVSVPCATVVADHRNNITATDTITIGQTGFYLVSGYVGFTGAAGATGFIHVALSVNGVLATPPVSEAVIQTYGTETHHTLLLTAGNTLSLWAQATTADYVTAAPKLTCRYLGPN